MRCILIAFAILLSFAKSTFSQSAQPKPIPFELGEIRKIKSSILNEERTLNIYLPEGYAADSSKNYPVIYLLDGSFNEDFIHIVGIVQFLTMIESMPKSIVVGIANIDRKRDFTFPTTIQEDKKDFPTTGHSEKFISFIEKELQPFVQNNYRTSPVKTIIGQSLGGLLATEIVLKKPYLFTDYMIISPSLWWNNESLLTVAPQYLEKNLSNNPKVYIAVGTEGKRMENDAKKLAEILKINKNATLYFMPLANENHLTILHNSIYKGLEMLFNQKK